MRSSRVQTKKLRFRVDYLVISGWGSKPRKYVWYVYESTTNKCLWSNELGISLNNGTGYSFDSNTMVSGCYRTRSEARAVCWWAKHMMKTIVIRGEE